MTRNVLLIDGNSLINRAFYALPPLTNALGEPTNAVYGFTMMLLRVMEDYSADGVFVAFDVSAPTFRHKRYEAYKGTRQKMPDDLRPQIGIMKDVLDALGIPRLELPGYEADDIIGTVAKKAESAGNNVYIVTGDKDSLQLISPKTQVILTKKGIKEIELMDESALKERYGLTPRQIVDLKGLMGDSSDNIPGVPGVGEKTALKLLAQFPSLEELYAQISTQKGKLRERLEENEQQAFLSRELATIDCNVPIEVELEQTPQADNEEVGRLFARLEFNTLLERLNIQSETKESASIVEKRVDEDSLEGFLQDVEGSLSYAIHLEVDGEIGAAQVSFLAMSLENSELLWVLTKDSPAKAWDKIIAVLSGPKAVYCKDSKLLYSVFANDETDLNISFDVTLAAYCLDPTGRNDLPSLSAKYLGTVMTDLAGAPLRIRELVPLLQEELKAADLWELFTEIEMPLAPVLARMERRGILVDPGKLEKMSTSLQTSLELLTKDIFEKAGESFNINSPKQLGEILFSKLGLPVLKKTKSGPSTSAEVLEQLSDHPIVASLLEFRQITKLKSTYADALAELISPLTKRIHSTFNQVVTATGRLSSTNPNLQNIPIRSEAGRKIREAFVAPKGHVLLAADYSQIELRILAHISQDDKFIEAFRKGIDIHTQTAAEILGIPLEEVTQENRSAAKAVNFGIIYGISSFGLAKGTNLSRAKAQKYIDEYFARYPKVKEYLDRVVKEAEVDGYVTTLCKRRRFLPDIRSRNYSIRNFAARTAMNTPIQGSAADIIKLAMIHVEDALRINKMCSRLLLQVHDELVLEVPCEEKESTARLIQKEMESVLTLSVPLVVDVKVGENWRDMTPFDWNEG